MTPSNRNISFPALLALSKASDAGVFVFFICAWTNDLVNNRDAGDLRRNRVHYDVNVMPIQNPAACCATDAMPIVSHLIKPFPSNVSDRYVNDLLPNSFFVTFLKGLYIHITLSVFIAGNYSIFSNHLKYYEDFSHCVPYADIKSTFWTILFINTTGCNNVLLRKWCTIIALLDFISGRYFSVI